ncbi:hypothetical protein BHU72_02260 [Desulfuribacillus stibiiarsenatis]|uniref:Xaa-Pro dipeptidase n=1 Tax=Desulfuribacillus stibiiarsenatis TaxID=1390249 RepID=A0A1E5L6A0_9FIRM|nr:Xaa-Pro peptidase family protein [Desulfuribacillus stibiiarsenatis]OEH85641.1 hypothetical protein BHU72_02260 [Desulfuribacillus stibiiarsenatis]
MFQNRLEKLRQLLQKQSLDAYITTKQENRQYISNFTGTSGYLLVTANDAVLFTDSRYMEQAKEQINKGGVSIRVIEHDSLYWKTIVQWLQQQSIQELGFDSSNTTFDTYTLWKEQWNNIDLKPTNDLIAILRMVKDASEISGIKQATQLTDEAFQSVLGMIRPGIREIEIALALEFYVKKRGAQQLAFDIIVASGKRSALPHGVATNKMIEPGDFITIDFGIKLNGYCSDMTRTVVAGKASNRQKEIYQTVLTAQQLVLDNIKAGMTGKNVDEIARNYIYQNGYRGYFGHGLGHGLGQEVHEGPRLSPTSDTILIPGMVVTVEPGIYIPNFGGVRIEDDVVIENNGCMILNSTPKHLLEL